MVSSIMGYTNVEWGDQITKKNLHLDTSILLIITLLRGEVRSRK